MNRIELYSAEDYSRARDERKKRLTVFFALCALALFVFVGAMILRLKIPGIAATAALACVGYFFFSTKVLPYSKYCRYLRDMGEGLSRETEGRFASITEATRMVDGVEVSDFILRVEEGEIDERLFLWDADKPRPEIGEGRMIRVTSYSNFVKGIDLL